MTHARRRERPPRRHHRGSSAGWTGPSQRSPPPPRAARWRSTRSCTRRSRLATTRSSRSTSRCTGLVRLPLPYELASSPPAAFCSYRKAGGARRSPMPDFYIGAHAAVESHALLTRDSGSLSQLLPATARSSPRDRRRPPASSASRTRASASATSSCSQIRTTCQPSARSARRHALVALAVAADLRRPVVAVARRHPAVLRAAVPEAAVDEHRDAAAREHDVGLRPPAGRDDHVVLAEAQPARVQRAAERDLGRGVGAPVALHRAAYRRVARRGRWRQRTHRPSWQPGARGAVRSDPASTVQRPCRSRAHPQSASCGRVLRRHRPDAAGPAGGGDRGRVGQRHRPRQARDVRRELRRPRTSCSATSATCTRARCRRVDIATASFPCTDLSLAGNRRGLGARRAARHLGVEHVLGVPARARRAGRAAAGARCCSRTCSGFATSNGGRDLVTRAPRAQRRSATRATSSSSTRATSCPRAGRGCSSSRRSRPSSRRR